jgi:5-methylthioadenosine/S-adenosylhomocysteine deaminase
MDLNKVHLNPVHELINNLVYYSTGNEVSTVVIDGKIVMDNGVIKTVNEDEIVAKSQEMAEDIWSQAKLV